MTTAGVKGLYTDGNRTELEPNRTRGHEEPETNKNHVVSVLDF